MHRFEDGQHFRRADRIAHRERAARISEAEHHGGVEVDRGRDPLLHDVAADVDDMRDDALRNEAG
jgi:hypothetical protein